MESLIGGSKLFAYKYKDKDRSFLGFRAQNGLLNSPILAFNPPNLRISFTRQFIIQPKLFAIPLSSSDTQVAVEKDGPQSTEMHITDINQTKTVLVKFQLEKECSFGQTFHIVGDDPMFGLWDPENSVPMNWSDGHVWSIELDIPVGKTINFKFVMKQGTETISWQPGPNRVLETWETEKMITICEDWDNAESRKIIEGIPLSFDQLKNNQERLIDADYFVAEPPSILENIVAEIKKAELEDQIVVENNGRAVGTNTFSSLSRETKSMLVEDEGVPVLVPGLTLPRGGIDEELKTEAENDSSIGAGKAMELNLPESDLKDEHKNKWQNVQERVDVLCNDKKQIYETEQTKMQQQLPEQDNSLGTNLIHVFSDDIHWARRTLDKFLKSFGIL